MSMLHDLKKNIATDFVRTNIEGILRTCRCTISIKGEGINITKLKTDLENGIGKEMKITTQIIRGALVVSNE